MIVLLSITENIFLVGFHGESGLFFERIFLEPELIY